jgi:DNA-binding CsgD family transcriptional regulator
MVDDLHLLDPTSATLIAQLVDADFLFLVGTVRAGPVVPPPLAALWARARVRRVDLEDLSHDGVDTLLHLVLSGPVEGTTSSEIWTASQGNILFVRELVLGSLEHGRLVRQRDTWRLTGPLATTARLAELVEARLSELGSKERETLEILAVWEPAGLSDLEAIVGPEVLEALEHAGVITLRIDGRRQLVGLAHPLYGDILRAQMPALRRRRLLLDHAERIERRGSRRREDLLAVATARLEATGVADAELLVRAARLARYGRDFEQVERLARAALLDGAGPEAGLLLGEALHELGAFEEAERVLADAERATHVDDELYVLVVGMRYLNLMWGLNRADEALAANKVARQRVGDRPGATALAVIDGMLLTYSGRPREALALLAGLPDTADPWERAERSIAELPALIAMGRPETAIALARRAYTEHEDLLAEPVAIADASVHTLHEVHALLQAGRLAEAAARAEAGYDVVPATAAPDVAMWFAFHSGRAALLRGRPATAVRWLSEAVARSDEYHFAGPRRLGLSFLAMAHASLGDVAGSAAAAAELATIPEMAFSRPDQEFGPAWARVAAGDVPGGREVLLAAADRAASRDHFAAEASLRHDVVRLGGGTSVAARLEELAGACEGRLVAAYARHARAVTGGRPEALVEAAEEFVAIGADLLAAETLTEAAEAAQRRGDRRAASALFVRASAVASQCEGARTPALATPASIVPLTARERDVAVLAAQGASSKRIAERLYLSVRTVDNHLQNVYGKLGVTGRRELAKALADLPEVTPG